VRGKNMVATVSKLIQKDQTLDQISCRLQGIHFPLKTITKTFQCLYYNEFEGSEISMHDVLNIMELINIKNNELSTIIDDLEKLKH
jgi:hypothetical protein